MPIKKPIIWTDSNFNFDRGNEKEKKATFRELMMATEPDFDFQPWATEFYATAQWSSEGQCWTQDSPQKRELKEKINNFLHKLDDLQTKQPIIAIKIAAILASFYSITFNLKEQAKERLQKWLITSDLQPLQKIELAILISKNWPDQFTKVFAYKELNLIIFDLLVEYAASEPTKTVQLINEICHSNEHEIFYFCTWSMTKKVTLARHLKSVDPCFSCRMLSSFLSDARTLTQYEIPESFQREIADELWLLALKVEDLKARQIYASLLCNGYSDCEWWQQLLEKLLSVCKSEPEKEVITTLVIHAPMSSTVFNEAMALFEKVITLQNARQQGHYASHQDPFSPWLFASFLMRCINRAADDKTSFRNECIKANPNHPLIIAAKKAYWECFDWLLDAMPEEIYKFLELAISSGDEEISKAAAATYTDLCKSVTEQTKDSVAKALISIRQQACWGYRPPRENRPSRFIEIFETAFPSFSLIAPELAEETKQQALYNPAIGYGR